MTPDTSITLSRPRSEGLLLTKLGRWFLILLFILAIAATNTGNNGLFLALVMMAGALVVAHFAGALNVRGLRPRLVVPAEIFARAPTRFELALENPSRWLPRWLLVTSLQGDDLDPTLDRAGRRTTRWLTTLLAPRGRETGQIELLPRRRGRRRVRGLHVTSPFPMGFFSKSVCYALDLEILVYPELFPPSQVQRAQPGRSGEETTRRLGWGHDLLGLRPYRLGDDPRSIHWKQSARIGELIFKEHESEQSRRLLILFDNAVGPLDEERERHFERLVSEAATAALAYLDDGFEVSLISREKRLPFAAGSRQRHRILETLALVEPVAKADEPLAPAEALAIHLDLSMKSSPRPEDREMEGPP